MNDNGSIAWKWRVRAALLYLGFPRSVLRVPGEEPCAQYLEHHQRQSAAILGLVLLNTVLFALAFLVLSYLLVFHRNLYEDWKLEAYIFGVLRKLYLALAVFLVFGLVMAILGGMREMPLAYRLGGKAWVAKGASVGLIVVYGTFLVLLPLAVHASSLVPSERKSGDVYMVYEDNGVFPRWLFALAFYPMARASNASFGPESPVLLPISRESVETAIANGKVVYVGSHGTRRGLMLRDGWLLPEEFVSAPKHPELQLVYLSGCDSGEQAEEWIRAFSPAEVITYDRLSAVLEHVWWLWLRGPEEVRKAAQEKPYAE